jgi:periplasmic glucans biosynthesis protein
MTDKSMSLEPPQLANAPRCRAHNRAGKSCRLPAVRGRAVCRLHGGAPGTGAPKGERNGKWKHGADSLEAVALRRAASRLLREIADANG